MSRNGMGFAVWYFAIVTTIFLQSKNGQPLARYFPDVVANVAKLRQQQFVLDGELVIPVGGALSFDELQLRLHPAASRVQKLAAAHQQFISCSICSLRTGIIFEAESARTEAASGKIRAFESTIGKEHTTFPGHD